MYLMKLIKSFLDCLQNEHSSLVFRIGTEIVFDLK